MLHPKVDSQHRISPCTHRCLVRVVATIEAEQALVNANREQITRFETKIQTTLARVWGE